MAVEMGSCNGSNTKAIDASVGGLVWVRRRNGSWWPGRIVGLEELSESCLVSPRSGTPVKLLGREDASVDWYNLEKSKRVKAFRCGEYDECIEKAKAFDANSSKKVVKYARREDAILQALELECARQGKDQSSFSRRMDASGSERGISTRNSPPTADSSEVDLTNDVSNSEGRSDSVPELSQSGLSFEENISSSIVRSGQSRSTPNDSEDDGTEGVKRMRGLEDIAMGVRSKSKVQTAGVDEPVQEDSVVPCDLNTGSCLSNGRPQSEGKVNSSLFKRKRSQVSNAHEFLKRKNRHRPLTKVLESTTMVSVPVICNELPNSCGSPLGGLSDGRLSGVESNDSKKSTSAVMNNNSDSTGVSCENMTSLNAYEASHFNIKVKDNEVSSVSGVAENDTSDRLFDVPFVGEDKSPAGSSPVFVPCSSGRRSVGALGRQSSQSSLAEPLSLSHEVYNESGSTSSPSTDPVNNVRITNEKGSSKWQLKGKRNSRHISKTRKIDSRKYLIMNDESNTFVADMEHLDGFTEGSDEKVTGGVGGSSTEKNKFVEDRANESNGNKCMSLEELHATRGKTTKVKQLPDETAARQRFLPYRQSRFIIHSKYQMSDFPPRKYGSNVSLYDVELEVKASYKPQHVPLVSLMSKFNSKAIVGHPLTVEVLDDGHSDVCRYEFDPHSVESCHSVRPNSSRRRTPGKHHSSQPQASPSKSSKAKKSGQLSKKTRKLSSLGHKQFVDESRPVVEKLKGAVVACIPLKIAFSRINEAVNGLARSTNHALTSGKQ